MSNGCVYSEYAFDVVCDNKEFLIKNVAWRVCGRSICMEALYILNEIRIKPENIDRQPGYFHRPYLDISKE